MYIDPPKKFITLGKKQTFKQWSVNTSSKSHSVEIEILTLTSGFFVPQVNFIHPPKSISYRCALSQGQSGRHLPEYDESRLCKIQSGSWLKPEKKYLEALDSGVRSSEAIKSHQDYFEFLLKGTRQLVLRLDFNRVLDKVGPFIISLQFVPHDLNKSPLESLDILKSLLKNRPELEVDSYSFQQSQMLASHPRANEICNPTTIFHLSRFYKENRGPFLQDYQKIVEHCLNLESQLFGLWPQAILSANYLGLKGFFKINTPLKELIHHLKNTGPVGISIKYGKGELANSPLEKTTGHLITIIQMDEKQTLVLDSAAKSRQGVFKNYSTQELLKAWVRHQRLCYFISE